MLHFIKTPLINANEDTATLLQWFAPAGSFVHAGEVICLMETTKSTFEVQADRSGYLRPLITAGESVMVDQPLAVITDSIDEPVLIPEDKPTPHSSILTWTQKARLIAQKHQIDPSDIEKVAAPSAKTITEEIVLNYIQTLQSRKKGPAKSQPTIRRGIDNTIQRILILGGGNIADLVLDILARTPNQSPVGILDDNPKLNGTKIMDVPVIGTLEDCLQLWKAGIFDYAALAIGKLPLRAQIYEKLHSEGIPFANIIDPTASILAGVRMGEGNMIMGYCRIGPECEIGDNNFLSAYINLEHHNRLGNHCTFGPGVFTSGGVVIGNQVQFGTGIFIEPRLSIGDNCQIASGAVITTHIPPNAIVKIKTNFSIHPKAASG